MDQLFDSSVRSEPCINIFHFCRWIRSLIRLFEWIHSIPKYPLIDWVSWVIPHLIEVLSFLTYTIYNSLFFINRKYLRSARVFPLWFGLLELYSYQKKFIPLRLSLISRTVWNGTNQASVTLRSVRIWRIFIFCIQGNSCLFKNDDNG